MSTITGITLSPNNIIGPTDTSAILTVNLSSVSASAPTIAIDPSYIAYLDGSMTSIDGGSTWTGTIIRTLGMNKIDNTLTVTSGTNSAEIVFNVLEKEELYIDWIKRNDDILIESLNSYAISKNGKTVVLGQQSDSKVIVYKYYNLSWNSYTITESGDFGYSLDLSHDGTRLIVGAKTNDYCKIYEINNSSYSLIKTYAPNRYNVSHVTFNCGFAVAISGNGNIISYVRHSSTFGSIIDILDWNSATITKTLTGTTGYPKSGADANIIYYKEVCLSFDGLTIMLSDHIFDYSSSSKIKNCGIIRIYDGTNYDTLLTITGSSYNDQIGTSIRIGNDKLKYAYIGYYNNIHKATVVDDTNSYTFNYSYATNISFFGDNNDKISITSNTGSSVYEFNSSDQWVENTTYRNNKLYSRALLISNDEKSITTITTSTIDIDYYANILIRELSSIDYTGMTISPSNIIYPNTTSNFQINFTTNDQSLNDISGNLSLQSDAGYLDNIRLSNYGFRLEGEIKANGGYSNNSFITYNEFTPNETIGFSIEVPQSTYHITDSGKKIMYSPFSRSAEDNQGKIEVYDSSGNIEHTFIDDVVGSVYVNQEGNLIVIGLPKDDGTVKSYLFEDGIWNEYYNGNNEYPIGTNLGELVHLTGNNELMVVNNTTASNYEVGIYKESVARYATYFETDVSSIIYPINSLNFEVKLTTNDVPLADISDNASNLFSIDPSYIGYIDANSLSLSNYGFSLHGTFTVSGEYNLSGVKLFYEDFSSNPISLYSVLDLSINGFYFDSSFVTYLNQATNKITLDLNREDITNVDVSNSLILDPSNCGSITNVDISNSNLAIKIITFIITFQPAFQFENSNCSLTFDYNQGLLDASQTILFSVNNYVPQITNITNDNLFNYIDTSGTILLEFDRNLLRDLSLNDLSYNETKLNLQIEKLSDSSYNILVDPSGEYAETQVITVKDLVGADLSNISLEIDTIIPTFSEITLAPGALNYEVSGGILDVKFNKTLLDRDQLVLTSSSDISFTFLRQLNNTTSLNENPIEQVVPDPPPLFNFTYTIEGTDVSENIIKSALQKWDNIIVKHPMDTNPGDTKIHITFSVSEMEAGTLGYAYVDYVYFDDNNDNRIIDYSDNIYTSSGFIALSQASYNSMISETRSDGNTTLYYVLLHEIGHIVGIGPYFGFNNSPIQYFTEDDGTSKKYYIGTNALEKYRMYMNDPSLVGIPIEDDGGAGTANVHPEEQRITSGNSRHIGSHIHQGLDEELMTGWTESGNTIMPLSAVSIGFLEDMGYDVSYAFADIYRNMDYNGNAFFPSLLKMGITMETILPVFPTYSVVQYEVKSNDYGLKSIQDISFNYRGTHDVSNINIEVNTIIPDVSSIDIQNILYSDTSGIVTITFNDHDGYYFYGKDASMNIYLNPSLNGNINLNMETIPSDNNVWTGVITTISGEFYPDAKLYLQHSGMDGLINVDVSGTYRLDTDIRGLYITLPEMGPRDTLSNPNSQSINYLTYDHNTNKLETDVSFQFNIDVSNNLEQFPYTDICENFIEITSTDLSNGIVELDKGIGFIGKFWNGILTISGEVEGTFDICYNETLNPLRDDEVVEIREDKLTVKVNTILPDISNVTVPKLTYLDISGDVEIEFDKPILSGDENNIQIEYSLDDTNEYQFLNKYGDNYVDGSTGNYVFNSISYDANKKIALGIGTYTLTGITYIHPIFLADNSLTDISINGTEISNVNGTGYYGTVTITVTGNFGTASYGCRKHLSMYETDRLVYKDVEVSSLVQNSATHWKYTLSLPQEIDTSLNVTIKYRDETSGPHIIPIYGIVPDVSSVTLSSTDLTYNDPSCVVTVEFNNALQDRANIYDLISLEPSSKLFIQDASFSSTDDRVWIGILDISNNVTNEFAYTDAKVSVNGIQSDAFGQGISGESVFNIDTILPDVSNISVSNLVYSINNNNDTVTKTTGFTITFTKTDLSGIDISNSLSVNSSDLSINNVGPIIGDQLTGTIETNVSNIDADFSFVLQYDFGYRNGTLNKDIDMSVNFTVDTVIRTVSISSNNYNLTYLTPSCEITVTFNTNEEQGKDISNSIAVKDINGDPIGYTLDPYDLNVSGNMWKATINISEKVDISGIIDISYNNDINNLYSQVSNIRFYTIVPDVSSVTLSNSEITYENPSIDLQVEYNKVLESRNDIFDLITLNASANLIEISGNSVSYDATNNVFKGIIKLTNTNLHDGTSLYRFEDNLKVVVDSLQSAMFSHIGISGESQLFQVDTLQQIENIELDTHHIYYPDVSNTLTVDFRIPIPSDTSLNNYVTLDEGYIVSQDDFRKANEGKTWTSVVTRVENMNLLDNKFAIDYSYNGLYNVSGEILFNAMENPEQRYMKFEEFDSSFVGSNSDRMGTGMALSYNNQIMAISSIYTETIKIYRLNGDNWTEIGIIPEKANSLALSEDGKIIVIGNYDDVIDLYNVGIAKIYTYIEDNSWNLLDTIIPDQIFKGYPSRFGKSVSISNNGNIIAVGISEYQKDLKRGYVKLYKRNTNDVWTSIIDISGNANNMLFGSNVKLSGNGLTLAVGSPGSDSNRGKINVYSFNDNYSIVSMNNEFIGDTNDYCGYNVTLTNDGKMINYGLRESNKIVIQNLENDTSYNFVNNDGINFIGNYGISTISNDKTKLFIFSEYKPSNEYNNYIESFEFYNNSWNKLGTKHVLTTINTNPNVKFITSNDGKQILYSNDNYNYNGGTNNGIVKTYNNSQSIRRRVLNFDLDLSNILYPDISTNFTINFTTNNVSMEDISNNLYIDPSNMGIIEVTETTNNGFNWVGKFTATELLKNDNNQLKYEDNLQENIIYTDTSFILFDIDRSPLDVSLLEITSTNSVSNHIRYDDVSGAIYLEFTRDQVTIDDVSFVTIIEENLKVLPINSGTIRDISTNNSGVSWSAVFEPSSNLITDCSLIFEYSGNEFELPIYRDYGFTIDTVTPDVSAININNISYTANESDVIVIFTKSDLNNRTIDMVNDISFNLTNINYDFSDNEINFVTHRDFTNNKVINDTWKTKLSVSGELFCDCEVIFHYVDPNGFYDISLSSSINIDTRKRGVEAMTITNDGDKVINGENYLFNYLDNSGSFLLDFFTNDLIGIDISSNLSLNGVSYTLDNYTVINDRLETNITINSESLILNTKMDFSLNSFDGTTGNSILRTGNTNTFNIDTRPREVTDISFNEGNKLSYLDPSGILTITFNLNIFETVDIITNKLNYNTSDLSLSSPQISNNIYTCTLTSNREFNGSSDVSINYNGTTLNRTVTIEQDTIIPTLDLSNCSISSHFIQYNQRYIDISLTFTNEIEDLTNISNTLVVYGLQDTSYNFSTFTTNNGGKFWSGQLNITEYEISLNDLYIYSNYQSGTTHSHPNLRFNVNTIRPYIESINFDKNILTYLEPSCNISITFGGSVDVLDTNIDGFISYSDISLSSFIKQSDNRTWNSIVDVYKLNIQNYVDLSINFYDQIRDTSIYVFTVLPEVNKIEFGKVSFTYLDKSARNFSIVFKNDVYDNVNDIVNSFQFENFPSAYDITYNPNTVLPYTTISGDLIFNYNVNITNALINYSYDSERFGNISQPGKKEITSIDTRIPNITEATDISNTNLTYDASSTQLDVYFDASLLDTSASEVLDASLVTSFVSDSSIRISPFIEINKRHYRANITTEYGIDKSEDNSVTVHYMDTSATLYFNVDTILRPYSNICFPKGEKVLTDNGYKNIEQIDIKLDTIRGQNIEELTQTITKENTLVVIKCGAFMENMPNKDTLITNNHKVLYKGKLIEAYKLVKMIPDFVGYVRYKGETLYNVLLEGDIEGKMVVNGMIVETLSPKNNIAKLYKDIKKYGTTEYKKKRMIELYNKCKR